MVDIGGFSEKISEVFRSKFERNEERKIEYFGRDSEMKVLERFLEKLGLR